MTARLTSSPPSAPTSCDGHEPSSVDDDWLLARRDIAVDEAVLRTQNLAVFL